ncbi:helix-turn-helix transcriptional regulator [Dickeya dianthicola]|uniref:winged helix-turn-helix transcriptional regulator n=1 Tax=Dickeya dianthicola TaxID=204039 RepID=UPI001F60909E|nr:helix-turn-helix domain-containing protein [Dickeya dianthicola]MCI4184661.1 helix-turn-helix transcriptional regulator [Dickeya dianthicola]
MILPEENEVVQNGLVTQQEVRCNVMAAGCPSRQALQHLTSRWGVLIVVSLLDNTHRFSSLRRHIEGVSERMLAQTLQSLENDGMINRHSFETIPPHVEYSLTQYGREIAQKLKELVLLIEEKQTEMLNKSQS